MAMHCDLSSPLKGKIEDIHNLHHKIASSRSHVFPRRIEEMYIMPIQLVWYIAEPMVSYNPVPAIRMLL